MTGKPTNQHPKHIDMSFHREVALAVTGTGMACDARTKEVKESVDNRAVIRIEKNYASENT